ncbi:50s ribosomal protein l24 [Stemphylium lycopersici]|uniref:Large ribosomal subunit protein bL28m n=1 Tax=Stemphylium lycopersici TaxID=183478 RepID=A0A364MYD9_STELY|nr:50s ribosomal protein l24 [Stemphylium lycopersici]RAR04365.1 50s ribosomal protein l24 [Stemphylium lycopersici]RAR06776.1 50s ribosomal protein l24 [Stemphylium lycopersici]
MPARCQLLTGRVPTPGAVLRSAQSTQRTYATTAPPPAVKNPLQRRRGGDLGAHLPKNIIPKDAYIPAYPYGEHQLFKQANKGLYGEQMIRFGNNVSTDTETKTRRNWKPNVLSKSLYSVALKKRIKLRITAKVLKTMDREGGLDEYLLKDNVARIKELGPMGWALRWTLMQKPEVIERLRADAAALGLDQATIDKQWPTPQMMAERKAAEGTLATDILAESEGQEMWAPEDADAPESVTTPSKDEEKVAAIAAKEYIKAVKAAKKYLSRGVVDSEEEGLKLAFIRAKEREEASAALRKNYKKQYQEADISAQELKEIRARYNITSTRDPTARKIAYNQRRRKEIEQAGGMQLWKAATQAAKDAAFATRVQEAGGEEAFRAARKAEYTKLIAEAETASTNAALDANKRMYLDTAIQKADKAIKAKATGGQDDYVESVMEDLRKQRLVEGGAHGLSAIYRASTKEKNATGDAWAALVNSSSKTATTRVSQPRA